LKDKTNQENKKIKRISTVFNIKTKQNQMEIDETGKKNIKKFKTKKDKIKQKTRIIIEFFFSNIFLSK
jgi:cell fate (sporulation/competence/biofilm development) regulator YlbF (YheA/YmcA/DUF963 family)